MFGGEAAVVAEIDSVSGFFLLVLLFTVLVDATLRHFIDKAECVQDDVVLSLGKLANIYDIRDFLVVDGPYFALVGHQIYVLRRLRWLD